MLVPEINLTPQLEQVFRQRLQGVPITSLHSALNDRERTEGWQRAQSGSARVVLGTRLAVFAPLPALALIVVDEEHDASFKQEDGLRYHARDVAVVRGQMENAVVVLGSADPFGEARSLLYQGWGAYDQWLAAGRPVTDKRQMLNDFTGR